MLTFDDGPDPDWTPPLLDLLGRAGARATFFPIASRAARQSRLVGRILAEGHAVGLHCHEHVRHSSRSLHWVRNDTARALELLGSIGVRPSLWRTPWGDTTTGSARVAREYRLRIVGWTVDTHDWRGDGAADMLRLTAPALRAGAVVLAHDGIGPGALRDNARQTVEYVRLVAAHAEQAGLKLDSVR